MIADRIDYTFPTTTLIDEQTTIRLQSLARNSREHAFANTRRRKHVEYGFDTDKPAEIKRARHTYYQHIRHGSLVVAHLADREYFHPVGYALAITKSETPLSMAFRKVQGKPILATLHEINILDEYQGKDFLPEELAVKALGKIGNEFRRQALASPEDRVMQTALHGLEYEMDPPYQAPRITHDMFGPHAPPVELFTYAPRGMR